MERENIKKSLFEALSGEFFIYSDSLRFSGDIAIFTLKNSSEKYLGIIGPEKMVKESSFTGQIVNDIMYNSLQ